MKTMRIFNMKVFDYVCPHGNLIDEYALFANIISKTDKTITYERYMNFGKIKCPNPITISIEDFNKYYVKYEDLWKHIGKIPLLFKIIKHWR